MVQFVWILTYAFITAISYGNFRDVPDWSKSVFLIAFAYSAFLLIIVQENLDGDEMVHKTKILAVGSIAIGFLMDAVYRYFLNGSF